jgi:sarcosine oxidase
MSAQALQARFPGWAMPDGFVAVHQPDAGFVASERAVVGHARLALHEGADLRAREAMTAWEITGAGTVRVTTEKGVYEAERLVLSTGAWIADHVPALRGGLATPERQVLAWFQPRDPALFRLGRFPVGIVETPGQNLYVFPEWGVPGFKIGVYNHLREQGHADALSREPNARDEALLREATETYFPEAAGATLSLRACLFTNTPDEHFVIDTLPGAPQVIVASPCSGHGFKFSSVVGEILADLATTGASSLDLNLFRLDRFASARELAPA